MGIRKSKTWPEIVELILEHSKEEDNKRFREWLFSKEFIGYHADYFLWRQAYGIQKKINTEDNDHFTVIAGIEGSGKSLLGLIMAAMVSPTFSMKHICFSISDFLKVIKEVKKGDTLMLDEGAIFLFSRESMSKDNRRVVKTFNLMRQLNLHIIVCIPNYNNMDSYIREHRVDTLLQIRKSKDTYKGITKEGIGVVNDVSKKVKDVNKVKLPYGSFWNGYWTKSYPAVNDVTEEAYRKKKREHLDQFITQLSKEVQYEEEAVISMVKISEFMKVVPMSRDQIAYNIQKGLIPGRKVGSIWYIDGEYYRKLRDLGVEQAYHINNTKGNGK